jgi:hypothetical protein
MNASLLRITGFLDWYSKKNKITQRFGNWMFSSSGEGWETHTLLGPLERANLNHWPEYTHIASI